MRSPSHPRAGRIQSLAGYVIDVKLISYGTPAAQPAAANSTAK